MTTIYDYGRSPEHWLLALDMASQGINYLDRSETACDVFCWMEAYEFDIAFLNASTPTIVYRNDLKLADESDSLSKFAKPLPFDPIRPRMLSMDDAFHVLEKERWFVIGEAGRISGIVTRDDAAKPAACAFVLAHLITLERALRRLLGSYTNVPMPDHPADAHQNERGYDAGEIHFLSQVLNAAGKHQQLLCELGMKKDEFKDCAAWAIGFRNHLAHARSFDTDHPGSPISFQRFRKIQQLMHKAIVLVGDRCQVWLAFTESVIVDAHGKVIAGPRAEELPVTPPAYVVTAANPYEQNMSPEENGRRNSLLKTILYRRTDIVVDVVGQSPCGKWQENSFLVSGVPEPEMLKIASRFGQRAIFKLTENQKTVVATDGREKGTASRIMGSEE